MQRLVARLWDYGWVLPVLAAVVVALLPRLGLEPYWVQQVTLMAIYALIVAGLNLTWGYAGELALGQVAMWATGAYVAAILARNEQKDILTALVLSGLAAGLMGLLAGLPALRLSGWPLALSSIFLVLLIPSGLMIFETHTHGLAGIAGVYGATLFGSPLEPNDFYVLTIVVAFGWLLVMRNSVTSRLGIALQLMRKNRLLASSLGVGVPRMRFFAYVLGAIPAGMAGAIFAYSLGVVSPVSFQISTLITLLAASVIGGSRSVWGVPVGAFLIVWGPSMATGTEEYFLIVYGVFLIVIGAFLPGGIAGLAARANKRLQGRLLTSGDPRPHEPAAEVATIPIPGQRLEVRDVVKSFGGLQALAGARLEADPGKITALIGPNGAGKTTLLNVVCGFVSASGGSVCLGDAELLGTTPSRIARNGVGRTFQTPQIPEGFTVLDVVLSGRLTVGRYRVLEAVLRLPGFRRQRRSDVDEARAALRFAGLEHLATEEAEKLPLGTARLLEVVRSIAGAPGVLLLDEPAAGLDEPGLAALRALLVRARDSGATIVLVEHNVPFVLGLADDVWVLNLGRPLAHGTPDEIRNNEKVIDIYLGRSGRDDTPAVAAP